MKQEDFVLIAPKCTPYDVRLSWLTESRGPNAGKGGALDTKRDLEDGPYLRANIKMNFELPADLQAHLAAIDSFVHSKILPLQHADDNNRFFDHRREYARTDWENNGNPRQEWEALLGQ